MSRVAEAIPAVERGLAEGDRVTQFEALTAAAFVAFAAAKVDVAVVEAGLGGRLDATNVLPSRVTALPSIGLDHTDCLGETEVEIAAEKLAVLRDHSPLVTGDLSPDVAALAERTAAEHGARGRRRGGTGGRRLAPGQPALRRAQPRGRRCRRRRCSGTLRPPTRSREVAACRCAAGSSGSRAIRH